jgi:hypothetical protein
MAGTMVQVYGEKVRCAFINRLDPIAGIPYLYQFSFSFVIYFSLNTCNSSILLTFVSTIGRSSSILSRSLTTTVLYLICSFFAGIAFSLTRGIGRFLQICAIPPSNIRNLQDNILHSPVTLAFASMAWRNAWKYQSRSYRHWFWDSGVIAANFLATCYSMELSAQLIMGFVDDLVNRLLRIDDKQEAAIVLAPLTNNSSIASVPLIKQTEDLSIPKTMPLSREQVDYPEIWKLHKASYLYTKEEVKKWITAAANHFKQTPTKNTAQKEVLHLKPLEFETFPINEA